jgi:hypothetical protein
VRAPEFSDSGVWFTCVHSAVFGRSLLVSMTSVFQLHNRSDLSQKKKKKEVDQTVVE